MRNLTKLVEPNILTVNSANWLVEYLADPDNETRKYRYRHAEIKQTLRNETGNKCIYCESKVGHNTPGDIEHKVPTSVDDTLRFVWVNLTLACTECNRRKNAYFDPALPFLDPYNDDVESLLRHYGPVVGWKAGEARAEASIRVLELSASNRAAVITRKIETIEEVQNLIGRYNSEADGLLKKLLLKQLISMADKKSEYSAMVLSLIKDDVPEALAGAPV